MRRTELELHGKESIEPIIKKCTVLRLGMVSQRMPYIMPMVFGFRWTEEYPVFFMHCGMAGRKNDALFDGARLCFEMDIEGHLTGHTSYANGYSREFCCVMGEGSVTFARSSGEKMQWFEYIMAHQTGKGGYTYQPGWLTLTRVFALRADKLSASRKGMSDIFRQANEN